METIPLLQLRDVGKSFAGGAGGAVAVLEHIELEIRAGEIVVFVGRSGCGKSTLLRMICGLTEATSGEVLYKGRRVVGAQAGISMVFQTFALFPWLTVQQNVELGLEAQAIAHLERERRAASAIEMIGLSGFESAYPKELSGGMRQRVGFARALVVNPDVLLMDEAFSALDVPTTETLRNDLLDLWLERQISTRAIVMVSHSIEDSLLLADRVVILDSNPGRIKQIVAVDLKHPRDRDSHVFRQRMDAIYSVMSAQAMPARRGLAHPLPGVSSAQMLGMLEELNLPGRGGSVDLPALAENMQMEVNLIFPIIEALDLLDFAHVVGQRVALTRHGKGFVEADIARRKVIFSEHLLQRVTLVSHIRRVLDERARGTAPKSRFLRELEDSLTEDEAERVLAVAIDWGRYAEVFAYDTAHERFSAS